MLAHYLLIKKHFVYLVGVHIYYKMIHGPYSIIVHIVLGPLSE